MGDVLVGVINNLWNIGDVFVAWILIGLEELCGTVAELLISLLDDKCYWWTYIICSVSWILPRLRNFMEFYGVCRIDWNQYRGQKYRLDINILYISDLILICINLEISLFNIRIEILKMASATSVSFFLWRSDDLVNELIHPKYNTNNCANLGPSVNKSLIILLKLEIPAI